MKEQVYENVCSRFDYFIMLDLEISIKDLLQLI